MPQHYRDRGRDEHEERGGYRRPDRMRWGEDRHPHQSDDERRYLSDWDRDDQRGGSQDERTSSTSPEEFAYRPEDRNERAWRGREGEERDQRSERRNRGSARSSGLAQLHRAGEPSGPTYYGAGSHFGGGYSTAPSSRAAAAGSFGAPGFGGAGAFSGRDRWLNEGMRTGTSGHYANYGRSRWGAQSGYGRDYGSAEPSEGPYRGRGPKGYERSDERLRELICERLTDDPRIDASDVHVEVSEKIVKLTGTTPDRRTKHLVEDAIDQCGGVQDIHNELRVQRGVADPRAGEAGPLHTATAGSMTSQPTDNTRQRR